jgi:molecular chaperone GrpE
VSEATDSTTATGESNLDSPVAESLESASVEVDPLTELTADLQRITAEYANYRKRVDRDRLLARDLVIGTVLLELIPTLDDINNAKSHGELNGGFAAIADKLSKLVTKFGLTEAGDIFDPMQHEALQMIDSAEHEQMTVIEVMRCGYSISDRLLRPAQVIVAQPAPSSSLDE